MSKHGGGAEIATLKRDKKSAGTQARMLEKRFLKVPARENNIS